VVDVWNFTANLAASDPKSIRAHVEHYKTFRLLALQTSPEAFGSNYAREIAFTDDIWYNRLANKDAATFIALDAGRTLSTLTILGPLSFSLGELPPSGKYVLRENNILLGHKDKLNDEGLRWVSYLASLPK